MGEDGYARVGMQWQKGSRVSCWWVDVLGYARVCVYTGRWIC